MSSPKKIRVLIVDDSAFVRRLVSDALAADPAIEVVGTAANPYEARDRIRELSPDVLTLDLEMPRMDGLQVLTAVRRDALPTRVILLSAFLDGAVAFEAVAAGAAAYLSKEAERGQIADTILLAFVTGDGIEPSVDADFDFRHGSPVRSVCERSFESLNHQVELGCDGGAVFLLRGRRGKPGTHGNRGFQPVYRLIQPLERIAQPIGNFCHLDASNVPASADTMGGTAPPSMK